MSGLVVDLFAGGGGASPDIDPAAVARFASRVRWAPGDDCWEWQGGRSRRADGTPSYGFFFFGKRRVLAHRFAFEVVNGALSAGAVVRHRCDNVACVRPDHLDSGTQAQNLADMRERGRAYFNKFPSGESHPNAKLNANQVRELRRIYAAGGVSCKTLGLRFGLTAGTVHDIVTCKTWRQLLEAA